MEKNFKKGDRFTPHKPKDVNEYPLWQPCMDLLNGKTLVIENITSNGEISAECCLFHPDWCEKVEDTHIPDVREIVDSLELPNNQDHIVEANKMIEERFPDIRKTIDWEQRRYELAKAAMQGILSNSVYHHAITVASDERRVSQLRGLVDVSLQTAESMIELLKETEEQLKEQ